MNKNERDAVVAKDERIAKLKTENDWLQDEMANAISRNDTFRAALEYIAKATGEEACPDGYSAAWHARRALGGRQ